MARFKFFEIFVIIWLNICWGFMPKLDGDLKNEFVWTQTFWKSLKDVHEKIKNENLNSFQRFQKIFKRLNSFGFT